jgi:hypothetical protein
MTTPRIIPVFTAAQIVRALQTNWGGSDQGTLRSWTGPRVTYSVPTTAPFDVFGGSAETAGFTAPGKPGALTLSGMAALAFELWDDLIAISLDPVTDAALAPRAAITVAFSATTRGGGIYAQNHGTVRKAGLPPGSLALDAGRVWLNPVWPEF